jgi:hypothetical protein
MSAIKFHKASEYKKVFNENGLARQSVLTGEYKDVAIYKCTLAAGAKWEPELYPQQEKVQILLFTEGTGYVATPHKAFQIEEVSVFVPRFDQESFFIQADSELSFLQIVANLSDYDRENMADSHIALPRFRPVSQGWQYEENFKTRDIESYTLIEHRYFGRFSMGAVYGKGPNEVGQHIHNELEQWYYALPGAKFTYHVNDEEIPFNEGDLSYTPHGNYHGTSAEDGQRFDYIWFELCENGYPGQLK